MKKKEDKNLRCCCRIIIVAFIKTVIEFHAFFVLIAFFSKAAKNIDFFYIFTSISREQ